MLKNLRGKKNKTRDGRETTVLHLTLTSDLPCFCLKFWNTNFSLFTRIQLKYVGLTVTNIKTIFKDYVVSAETVEK